MRKKRGYKHWVGSEAACESCGTRITVRGHAHKYCENCARERVRVRQRQKRVAARSREST
jgi:Zn finger protein HypA/HybF involved in hydrogenase expression